MFEKFTDSARRVVVLAQENARELSHGYIGTEHLLIGLMRESDGVAARALTSLDLSQETIQNEILAIIAKGQHQPSGHIPFTPRAKKVLELSLRESLQLGHDYIGTEHILLALVREGEGVAAQALTRLGAGREVVRAKVMELLPGSPAGGLESAPPAARRWRSMRRDDILIRFDSLAGRVAAIEQRLGIGPAAEPEPQPAAGFEGDEAARLRAEVSRLRQLLTEHDVDPGDQPGGEPGAATP